MAFKFRLSLAVLVGQWRQHEMDWVWEKSKAHITEHFSELLKVIFACWKALTNENPKKIFFERTKTLKTFVFF